MMVAVLIDERTRVLVQGMGKEGTKAALQMREYGTPVLCGVAPGRGGDLIEGIPVYETMSSAVTAHPAVNASMVCVPPSAVRSAVFDAIDAGIPLVFIITESTPIHDTARMISYARQNGTRIVGPSSVGAISPGKGKIGMIGGVDNHAFSIGDVGIISKSGGMCSETALLLTNRGIGQSTVFGIGGDKLIGSTYADLLELFERDAQTRLVILYGEVGGTYEEEAALFIKERMSKPVVAFISGKFASTIEDVALGHAGAIIEGNQGTRDVKIAALKDAGVHIAEVHHEIVDIVARIYGMDD